MDNLIVELYLIVLLWISSFTIVYFAHKIFKSKINNKVNLFIAAFFPCSLFAMVSFAMINFMVRKVNMLSTIDSVMIMFLESLPTAFIFGGIPLIYLIYRDGVELETNLT